MGRFVFLSIFSMKSHSITVLYLSHISEFGCFRFLVCFPSSYLVASY